jgi:hypothetical protein
LQTLLSTFFLLSACHRGQQAPWKEGIILPTALPATPHLDHLKKQAKDLLKAHEVGDVQACALLRPYLPRFAEQTDDGILRSKITLHDAQHAIAQEYGFAHWAALSAAVYQRNRHKGLAAAKGKISVLKDLDEKMRQHLERLGFASVGAYRIWCHKEGLGGGLDKSAGELHKELVYRQQEQAYPELRRDYRPAEVRAITKAYQS